MKTLIALVFLCVALAGCQEPTTAERIATMSDGHKTLVVDLGHDVPASDLRIATIDAQLRVAADRFGITPQLAGDQAVVGARLIRAEGIEATASEVLAGALAATEGADPVPPADKIIALYVASRTSGSDPETAAKVARALWSAAAK
jgi:hypothetical protein